MSEEDQLKRMVMTFRVSELQMLLGFAGKNKTGRKNELQSRALDLVKYRSSNIPQKIRELYKSIQLEMMTFGDRSQAAAAANQSNIMSTTRGVSSAINAVTGGYNQSGVGNSYGNISHNTSVYGSRSSSNQSNSSLSHTTYSNQESRGSYPINPDVKLKNLPFFDILAELLKPCTLAPQGSGRYQEASFPFSLTPHQANKIAHSRDIRPGKQDYLVQVQIRFCLLETTCEQEDNFPPSITLKINEKLCPLPSPIPTNKAGVEPKRPSRPVNVTGFCKISPTVSNRILVTWASDYGRCYVISCYLVQKLTSEDLLSRLKSKGSRLADFTKSLIKQKLLEDMECEIATTSLRCSLLCPLGKMRMVLPCRAETCNHLQCFDASLFLQMNERKPTWTCPVCDKQAIYDNLVIDGYFQEVLQSNSTCNEVTLNKDGSWTPLVPKKEPKEQVTEKKKSEVAVETLSDDSDDDDAVDKNDDFVVEAVKSKRKPADVEIITLTDSEDEGPPPKKLATCSSDTASSSKVQSSSNTSAATIPSENSETSDSWHVGEVDHGKRLVFRKAPSTTNGNSAPTASPVSSRSGSPQVICLDSPVSSPSPPSHTSRNYTTTTTTTVAPSIITSSSLPTTEPPPYTSSSSSYTYDSTQTITSSSGDDQPSISPTVPVSIIPVSSQSPGIVPSSTSPYLMSDPLFAPPYLPPTGSDPFTPPYLPPSSNLPHLFSPLGMNLPGQSSSTQSDFRSQEHY